MFTRFFTLTIALLLGISSVSILAASEVVIAKPATKRGITEAQWQRVTIGMSQQQVIKICGEPLPQHKGKTSWLYWMSDRMVGVRWENGKVAKKGELSA